MHRGTGSKHKPAHYSSSNRVAAAQHASFESNITMMETDWITKLRYKQFLLVREIYARQSV